MKIEINKEDLFQPAESISDLLIKSAINKSLDQIYKSAEQERIKKNIPSDGSWGFLFWLENIENNKFRLIGIWCQQ